MKKIIMWIFILGIMLGQSSASFLFQETDPYCTISGTTHNSVPGEISDTSSWSIPTAYQGECDETPELSENEKENIYNLMLKFFQGNDYTGSVYGGGNIGGYGGPNSLNPDGQVFVRTKFFPAVITYIENERKESNPNTKKIAVLNYAVKTIGYDYFMSQPQ